MTLRTLLLTCLLALPMPLWAGGMAIHMFQSEKALERIDDPDLKQLLTVHREAWISGTQYPDAGYSPGFLGQPSHVWGEASHWAPFILEYLTAVKAQCLGRYLSDPDCGRLVAHFLGAAAHGMQDQVFDSLFIPKVTEVDHRGQETTDTGIDMILLQEHDRRAFVPRQWYTPVDLLEGVYRRMGFSEAEANRKQIITAAGISRLGNIGERIAAPALYHHFKAQMPWGSRNYVRYPGGVEFGGKVVANFWHYLWRRLNDQPLPARAALTHLPAADAVNVAIDKRNTDIQISVTFDRYLIPASVSADSFIVTDEFGHRVRGRIGLFADPSDDIANANMLYFRPNETLLPETRYEVQLSGAILDDEGNSILGLDGYRWQFTTEAVQSYVQLHSQDLCLGLRHYAPDDTTLAVELHRCRVTRHQHWYIDDSGRWHNRERPDLCLQPRDGNIRIAAVLETARCSDNAAQQWLQDATTETVTALAQPMLAWGTFLRGWAGVQVGLLPLRVDARQQWRARPVVIDTTCRTADVYSLCWAEVAGE